MDTLLTILTIINTLLIIIAGIIGLLKPLRERVFGIKKDRKDRRETDCCLLRNRITDIYYTYKETKSMPEYVYEDLAYMVEQYIKLGGNAFVEKIWKEMQTWDNTR